MTPVFWLGATTPIPRLTATSPEAEVALHPPLPPRDSAPDVCPTSPPEDAAPDPQGSEGADVAMKERAKSAANDPLFQKEEPQGPAPKRALLLWQFFLFPVLIVVAALGVFLLFGLLGSDEQTPEGLMTTILKGGANRQKQAAQQLGILISEERRRIETAKENKDTEAEPAFYASPAFHQQLLRAFELARKEGSRERQRALARAIGVAQVTAGIPRLLDVLYPEDTKQKASPQEVRRAAAAGLLHFESRAAESAYLRLVEDAADSQVRVMGMSGPALLGLPQHGGRARDATEVMPALVDALDDTNSGVRLNAAYALALRGDERAIPYLKQSLTDEGLKTLGIHDEFRREALSNAIRGSAQLGAASLRVLVEQLTDDKDAAVGARARTALEQWRSTKGESSDAE